MYEVFIYVKPEEVLTVDAETGEILRRVTGCHRDLLVSQAILYSQSVDELPKIVYQKEDFACIAYQE